MAIDDNFYMSLALNAAWPYQGLTYPNPAVGCVVLDKFGTLLSVEAHQKAGEAHAELRAIAAALYYLNPKLTLPSSPQELHPFIIKNHQNLLKDSSVYVTLEPCNHQGSTPPCSKLLKALNIKRLCIGTLEENQEASGGARCLRDAGVDVKTKIMKKECDLLVTPFRAWQDGHFSFAKLAMTSNGVMDGGVISGISSRTHVHALRNVITMLAIGGNTVREDKPKLDARLVNGKAPNIFIYTRSKVLEKEYPLFKVKNRQVFIGSNWDYFTKTSFGMVEAGPGMLERLPKSIKWMLLFRSPNFKKGQNIQASGEWKLVWQGRNEEDSFGWYLRE